MDKSNEESTADDPITGLPESRKRPHAFGTPSIPEFLAAISKHRGSHQKTKTRTLDASHSHSPTSDVFGVPRLDGATLHSSRSRR